MKNLQVYVSSKARNYDDAGWEILVKVKDITDKGVQFSDEYLFFTNSRLSRMKCLNCDDNEYLDIATNAAKEHMSKLRKIKYDDNKFSILKLFNKEE